MKMTLTKPLFLVIIPAIFFGCPGTKNSVQMATRDFEFVSGGKKLSGIIDEPLDGQAKALIIFVHGSGPTDIRRENRYFDLRARFTSLGITCVTWDKPGRGRSEGMFDDNQPLEESATEILDAISQLRSDSIAGSEKIGVWGTSRGGWVAPIALSRNTSIQFWISVSGVPAEDNKYYLVKSNLPLEGRTKEETNMLMEEWKRGKEIFLRGGDYLSYLAATQNLRTDSSVIYFAGELTGSKEAYEAEQQAYLSAKDKYEFDEETLSMIRVPDFDEMLSRLNIDVLALFGEKDTNVNWRKAETLYRSTIGKNRNATLTVEVIPDCNHSMSISATGSVREVEGTPLDAGVKCPGYYEAQIEWLKKHVVSK
jgi:uncharacterized protein